jgi:hypothetical protein
VLQAPPWRFVVLRQVRTALTQLWVAVATLKASPKWWPPFPPPRTQKNTCPSFSSQGLPKHLSSIEEVSEYASKEYSLERTLDKMQADWGGVAFEHMPWRATGTHILRALDDVQMLLDDQIVKTQSMRASPYIGMYMCTSVRGALCVV